MENSLQETDSKHLAELLTLDKYRSQTSQFVRWIRENQKPFTGATIIRTTKEYLLYRKKQGLSVGSLNMDKAGIKYCVRYLMERSPELTEAQKYVLDKDLRSIKLGKIQDPSVKKEKILSEEEIRKLYGGVSDKLRLILRFLAWTGTRVSEALQLRKAHIRLTVNGGGRSVCMCKVTGKREREREVKVPKELIDETNAHFCGGTFLFETRGSKNSPEKKPYRREYIYMQLVKAGKNILGRKVTPHMLRHSFATRFIGKGKNYKEVSNYLGHSDPSITLKLYVHTEMDETDLFEGNEGI